MTVVENEPQVTPEVGIVTFGERRDPIEKLLDAVVKQRVENGIALLKAEYGPDFADHIDLKTLDLEDTTHCVLGQLYANADLDAHQAWLAEKYQVDPVDGYAKGLAILDGEAIRDPSWFGFDSGADENEDVFFHHDALTEEWRRRLQEMKHGS